MQDYMFLLESGKHTVLTPIGPTRVCSVLFLIWQPPQDGDILKGDDAIDDDEFESTWKAMQQQASIKGHSDMGSLGMKR